MSVKPIEIGEAAKANYQPLIIGRVSTSDQRLGLPDQMIALEKESKRLGFKKSPKSKAVRQSGFEGEQETEKFVENMMIQHLFIHL